MNQIKNISFSLFIILSFSSCSFFIKKLAGIKNPKVESKETISRHLQKNNVPLNNNYILKSTRDSSSIYANLFKGLKGEILLFNRQGQKYCYHGTDKCTGKQLRQAYSDFNKSYSPCIKDSSSLSKILLNIEPIVSPNEFPDADYYLIVYWCKFSGGKKKISQDYKWIENLKMKSNLNTSIVYVNCDLQEQWGLKMKRKMKLKFKLKNKKSASFEFGKIPYK